MFNLAFVDDYPTLRHAELLREAENDRLADLATEAARPLRSAIAHALLAAAERIEGRPRESIMRAPAIH